MCISENILKIKSNIPQNVKLIAVSKTKPNEDILEAYNSGHKLFGENKVQDIVKKYEDLPKDIEWHFIGHLQRNKVKFIVPFVRLIHAVDSLKLLKKINDEAAKNKRIVNCLMQIHIARESSKFGLDINELREILSSEEYSSMENIEIEGLMGMATYTDNKEIIKNEFVFLSKCFKEIKNEFFSNTDNFKEISMGMSDDYDIAVESGSTMVRVGSIIFGERNY
ncbi:MAG: YggS family pyridoxal phosphate-dependent enzyme [Bacteroidales bacterium]|nr:YggS family pyridoxal phosphate-dependent enzyme [Bacteroidales bacterium]